MGVQGVAVHASANGWWVVALIGALLATASGIVVVFRARQWSGLSAKYDAPSKARPPRDPAVAAWDALDRGEDPTA